MLGNRTNEQWIAQYSTSHQHPINRLCHTLGDRCGVSPAVGVRVRVGR